MHCAIAPLARLIRKSTDREQQLARSHAMASYSNAAAAHMSQSTHSMRRPPRGGRRMKCTNCD
eukprot:3001562-Lingulodinium_polyedra.AAC.1